MNPSKKLLAAALCTAFLPLTGLAQTTIAEWTFESSQPDLANSATISGISAEIGSGVASGFHASADTDWSSPDGNGSDHSFSSSHWAPGDYYQFVFSTTGLGGIGIDWDQRRSGTGPETWDLQYSLDGSSFTTALNDYSADPSAWVDNHATSNTSLSFDFGSLLDDQTSVWLRLVAVDSASNANGSMSVDNFAVTAFSSVPEPATYAWLSAIGALGFAVLRRRKRMDARSSQAA